MAISQGQYRREVIIIEEAADLFLEVGDKWGAAHYAGFSAVAWRDRGDHGRAKSLAEQGLAISREAGDKHGTIQRRSIPWRGWRRPSGTTSVRGICSKRD